MHVDWPNRLPEPGAPRLETYESSDGYVGYYRHFAAHGTPRGRIVFIHGIQSHGGWYPTSSAALAAQGYDVYFLDRRGCGLNTAHRGDAPNFRRLLDDIIEFLHPLRAIDGLPLFLGAISWGGKLGCALPYRQSKLIDGLILFAPGLFARVSPPFLTRIMIGRAALRDPRKMFDVPLSSPALFTATPERQAFIERDRYSLRRATGRLLFQSIGLDMYLKRARKHLHLPILLLLAGQDRVVNNAKVRAYIEGTPSLDRTIMEYPQSHHTLEFEPEPLPFLPDVSQWLTRQMRGGVR